MSDDKNVDGENPNLPKPDDKPVVDNPDTPDPADPDTPAPIDYEVKFSESSKEANRLFDENKTLKEDLEAAKGNAKPDDYNNNPDEPLYPGFENLGEAEQKNLIEYTNGIAKRTLEGVYKDPAIAHAQKTYAKSRWNDAFNKISEKFPDLKNDRADFEAKFYNEANVPENIDTIIEQLAKSHLYDKTVNTGNTDDQNRIDAERAGGGGNKPTTTSRTLEDWNRLAVSNPAKFAKQSKQYHQDLESGKLK